MSKGCALHMDRLADVFGPEATSVLEIIMDSSRFGGVDTEILVQCNVVALQGELLPLTRP